MCSVSVSERVKCSICRNLSLVPYRSVRCWLPKDQAVIHPSVTPISGDVSHNALQLNKSISVRASPQTTLAVVRLVSERFIF